MYLQRSLFCLCMMYFIFFKDYYYFKRDTELFSGCDGQSAVNAAKEYLEENHLWQSDLYVCICAIIIPLFFQLSQLIFWIGA